MALTPTVNAMRYAYIPHIHFFDFDLLSLSSVIGLISIPGMMTGSILGGATVTQAARLQMIIMFMLSASVTLSSIVATVFALAVVVDSHHRIRVDRIDSSPFIVWRIWGSAVGGIAHSISAGWARLRKGFGGGRIRLEENGGLIG
jgi:hypothetical protein